MNYIVFDLEFNQGFNSSKAKSSSIKNYCPFEIIHLGAVKLDGNLNETGRFDNFVKPKIFKKLHPVVKRITKITSADLKTAKSFNEVYDEFVDFVGNEGVFVVWGTSDIKELIRNIEYHKLDPSPMPDKYIDIQHYTSRHLKNPEGLSVGLSSAVKLLNIPSELHFHNAFNDAFYTAEVFKNLYNESINPETYTAFKVRVPKSTWKTSLETDKLITQFEKMFNRKMTEEDQNIIKLAYKMGYTKQFQKTIKPPQE